MISNQQTKISLLLKSALIGSLTACLSLPFEHPFDTIKTNMQASQLNLFQTFSKMKNQKGWKSFYSGFSLNLMRVMLKQGFRWPLWISTQTFYKLALPNTNQVIRQSIAGFSISFLQLVILSPLQRIKVWVMTTKYPQEANIKKYYESNYKFQDLYKGFLSVMIRQGISWSTFLASTEIVKKQFKAYLGVNDLQPYHLFLVSIPVAFINTTCIMPIDCIKTILQKYQNRIPKQRIVQVLKQVKSNYGIKGLYRGWTVRIIQYFIQSAFVLLLIQSSIKKYQNLSKK